MMAKLLRKLRRAVLNRDPSFCDMHEDAHARQAAQEYLGHIRRHLRKRFDAEKKLDILDAGCQAGRLLIPLAEDGHRLIGVDTSGFALRRAQQHAKERGLAVRLYRGNIAELRRWVGPASLAAVICAEVLYLCRDYEMLLALLVQSLKPGGLLCVSHRPAAFYAASALARGDEALAAQMCERSEGPSPDGGYHNWQTEPQLRALYERLGCSVLACEPVDHQEWAIEPGSAGDARLAEVLRPYQRTGSSVNVPAYLLVIAQRASWASA